MQRKAIGLAAALCAAVLGTAGPALAAGNTATNSIGTVQVGAVGAAPTAVVGSPVGDANVAVPAGSVDGGDSSGANDASCSIGTVQASAIHTNTGVRVHGRPVSAAVAVPVTVGGGDNRVSDSIGTVQVGGGNSSSRSTGTAQLAGTHTAPVATVAPAGTPSTTVGASGGVVGAGGNSSSDSIGTVQVGGGNDASRSTGTVQAGGANSDGGASNPAPLSPSQPENAPVLSGIIGATGLRVAGVTSILGATGTAAALSATGTTGGAVATGSPLSAVPAAAPRSGRTVAGHGARMHTPGGKAAKPSGANGRNGRVASGGTTEPALTEAVVRRTLPYTGAGLERWVELALVTLLVGAAAWRSCAAFR